MTQADDERIERRLAIVAIIAITIITLVDIYLLIREVQKWINQ